jgi:hypothetical protein
MFNRQFVFDRIHEDLMSNESMLRACIEILDYLKTQPRESLRFITFGALRRAAKVEDPKELLPIAQYLAGSRLHLLDTCYLLVEGDKEFEIESDEVLAARSAGVLFHPDRGEPVDEFEEKLIVYFSLSSDGKQFVEAAA